MNSRIFIGRSGAQYQFFGRDFDTTTWQPVPVNYLFVRESWDSGTFVAYAGESSNAQGRFASHERWKEAVRDYGVTHIYEHRAVTMDARLTEERDLIQAYNPPMNTQHKHESYFGGLAAAALMPEGFASLADAAPNYSQLAGILGALPPGALDAIPTGLNPAPASDLSWLDVLQPSQPTGIRGALGEYSDGGLFGPAGALGRKF